MKGEKMKKGKTAKKRESLQEQKRHLRLARGVWCIDSVPRQCPRQLGDTGPCPYVGCRHHMYLDIDENTGAIIYGRQDLEPWELWETCAIDAALRGDHTLDAVAAMLGVTRERVRQIESGALDAIYWRSGARRKLREFR